MTVLHTITEVRETIRQHKSFGKSIGLVPTMGALHQGHFSLIQRSAHENDLTVVSIFVNPLQFGPHEDLAKYPRTLEADVRMAENAGADIIFHPAAADILGDNMLTFVDIDKLQNNLCGRSRPGHFRGVCTIVAKLFNIVNPDRAYFGQKDIQQLTIIKKMAADLNFAVDIVPCPIVREADGLAMSSRNAYLSPVERQDAVILSRAIKQTVRLIDSGETSVEKILTAANGFISQNSSAKIDYVSLVDENMQDVTTIQNGHIFALAVYVGATRLIDNHIIGEPLTF